MKNSKGFTLIELMVVIVIIGIIAAVIAGGGIALGGDPENYTITISDKYSEYEEDWGTTYFVNSDAGEFKAVRQVWSSVRVDGTYNVVVNPPILGSLGTITSASQVQ